jgi:hypothetical protein
VDNITHSLTTLFFHGAIPMRMEGKMKPFDTSKWLYGRVGSAQTLLQLPEAVKRFLPDRMILSTVSESGGKALGLKICELMVRRSENLVVPQWIGLSIIDQVDRRNRVVAEWLGRQNGQVHVRSSARSEDWIDGAAGRHTSIQSSPDNVFQTSVTVSRWRAPVVAQEHVVGIGIVVDIAHSHILNQTVIRVATGREVISLDGTRTFTSATWDHEGRHELFDPNTGQRLMVSRTGKLFIGSCQNLPLWDMVNELWQRVRDLDIDFGVQLELVIHPDTPRVWNLVQIRPSPNSVRLGSVELELLPNSLTSVGIVSSTFNILANARLVTDEDASFLTVAGSSPGTDLAEPNGRFDGTRVLVWEKDPHPDFGLFQMRAAFSAGILLQVTRKVLMINTTHSTIERRNVGEQAQVLQENGVIAVSEEVHSQIVAALTDGPRMIHAISDGIVGQISLP